MPRPGLYASLAASTIALIFGLALIAPMPFWHAEPHGPSTAVGQTAADGLGWPAALLAVGFALALCAPYRPYILALRCAHAVPTRLLVLLTVALGLVAAAIFPGFGSDLLVYLDYERLWTVYGANPLLAFPNMHPEDWAFAFTWIPQQPSPYGPLWPILTWPIARLAQDDVWAWIGGYKLLSLAAYATSCGLVWGSAEPAHRKRALVLFAWSPLVLFEVLGKAHNDSLLGVSTLGAVWFARRHPALALPVATAGMLIKLSGLAVVLGLVVALLRRRAWRPLAIGLATSAGLTLAMYGAFWSGPDTLAPVLFQTSRVVWSPGALVISVFGSVLPRVDLLARLTTAAVWAATCALLVLRGRDLVRDTSVLLMATLLLLTTAFFAHYLVPVVALAALSGSRRLEHFVAALSMGSLAAYSVELLGAAFPASWIGSSAYQSLGSLVTLLPGAVLCLHWLAIDRLNRSAPDAAVLAGSAASQPA